MYEVIASASYRLDNIFHFQFEKYWSKAIDSPSHCFHKIFCKSDESGYIIADHIVAIFAVFRPTAPGNAKTSWLQSLDSLAVISPPLYATLSIRMQTSLISATIRFRRTKLALSALVRMKIGKQSAT